MDANARLVEIMSDVLLEIRDMKNEIKGFRRDTNSRLEKLESTSEELVKRVDNLSEQQAKTNLALSESRLTNMSLANKIEDLLEIDKRVRILENIVLNKAS